MTAWIKSIIVGVIVEIAQKLWAWFMSSIAKWKRSREQEKAADKFDEVSNKPDATVEDKIDANQDAINSGR